MKKAIIWIVGFALSAGVMMGAYKLYDVVSENYEFELPGISVIPNQGASLGGVDTSDKTDPDDVENDDEILESESSEPSESESESESEDISDIESDTEPENEPESESDTEAETETERETEAETSEYLAPDFTVYDENGNAVNLSDFFGKPIVLNFWASWCYYCKMEMPDFDEVAKRNPDVQFLMVNATGTEGETVDTAKKYIEKNGYDFDVYFDINQDALYTYGISSFPTTLFIASNGDLYTYYSGAMDADFLERVIEKVKEYNP